VIATKEQHIAEAERLLDGLQDLVHLATTKGVPMEVVPAASVVIAYAQAHAAVAQAFGGVAHPRRLEAARAHVAEGETDLADRLASVPQPGSRLVVPQMVQPLPLP